MTTEYTEPHSAPGRRAAAPPDRFCDLVMKGGITSGVVYPPAISALARVYCFKNIGGTSAGAIAAAVTAAAELRRRKSGEMFGFDLLEALPDELGRPDDRGRTRLLRLFQPQRACRRLFRILVGSLNAKNTWRRALAVIASAICAYWLAAVTGVLAAVAVFLLVDSVTAAVLTGLIAIPGFVGFRIYRDLTRTLVANDYGMCTGLTTDATKGEALTPWLHALIQKAAGLPLEMPLTFGDLWAAPKGPAPVSGIPRSRSIDLQMFSTNLSHGRPYIFPHLEPMARLFFRPQELARYLPTPVMDWLNRHALDYRPNPDYPASDPNVAEAQALGLREVPRPEHFPVLLAARMSLSFPLLFSAVPLWAIDYEQPQGERTFRRCMFSDGGISSNFPLHLFDGLIPLWPTFGIDLEAKLAGHANMVFLPRSYLQGVADRWTRFDQKPSSPSRMGGYLASIANTMQNWNDNTLARTTGVRDRVVRVRLADGEGGMNLNMPATLVKEVAKRGTEAALELIERFAGTPHSGDWDGWSFQRWVRLDVLLNALGQKTGGMQRALGPSVPHSASYADLIRIARAQTPPGHSGALEPVVADALARLISGLEALAADFERRPDYPYTPTPPAELRAGPPL